MATLRSRHLALVISVAALFALSWSAAFSQTGPALTIADVECIGCSAGAEVAVPISFVNNANSIASIIFSVDFDETRLDFDPTDADGDGTPDSVVLNVPPAFGYSVTYDPADTDGELDIFIADNFPPLASMPSRTIVTITFLVRPDATGVAPVAFSNNPAPSFGSTTGQSIAGTWRDGSVIFTPLSVALADFSAEVAGDHVQITWTTVSEIDTLGFNLWRSASASGPDQQLNAQLIPSQAPGSNQGFQYAWSDHQVSEGQTYWYWLEDVALSGASGLHGPVSVTFSSPTAVTLDKLTAADAMSEATSWLLRQWVRLKALMAAF